MRSSISETSVPARTFTGWILIPHELLHVLAHRLIGQPCAYQLGRPTVRSLGRLSRRDRVFVLLFPLGVMLGLGLGLTLTYLITFVWLILPTLANPLVTYWQVAPGWHQALWVALFAIITYTGTTYTDLYLAYQIVTHRDKSQPTSMTASKPACEQTDNNPE